MRALTLPKFIFLFNVERSCWRNGSLCDTRFCHASLEPMSRLAPLHLEHVAILNATIGTHLGRDFLSHLFEWNSERSKCSATWPCVSYRAIIRTRTPTTEIKNLLRRSEHVRARCFVLSSARHNTYTTSPPRHHTIMPTRLGK